MRVDGHKRTIVLPPRAGGLPADVGAAFADGALVVRFEADRDRGRPRSHLDAAHAAAERLVREATRRRPRRIAAEPGGAAARLGRAAAERGRRRSPICRRSSACSTPCATLDPARARAPGRARRCASCCWRCAALMDWYLERLEQGRRRRAPFTVEDIPID